MISINCKSKGFSLLEVIIAVFIIGIALSSSLAVISFTISASRISANKLIAVNLAQEGIEIVRNIRDSSADWASWHGNVEDRNYLVQYDSSALLAYEDKPLKLDSNEFYGYSSGNSTPFYRKISLNKVSNLETKVVSEIFWSQLGKNHKVTLENRLWNWR